MPISLNVRLPILLDLLGARAIRGAPIRLELLAIVLITKRSVALKATPIR